MIVRRLAVGRDAMFMAGERWLWQESSGCDRRALVVAAEQWLWQERSISGMRSLVVA